MHRFFVTAEELQSEEVLLGGETLHHMGQVLRLPVGEEVLLLDGTGTICRCRIVFLDRRVAKAVVLERHREKENVLPVRLLQGIPKGDKMDLVLQKGTELGMTAFTPVISARSISRPAKNRERKRQLRWKRIVCEAARQSRRSCLPELTLPRSLTAALDDCHEGLRLLLWEEESRPLASVLPETPPRDVAILVGPEGGITGEEAESACRSGFIPVRLGPRILRTETAGFAIAAILQYLYGDLAGRVGSPTPETPREENR